MESLPDIQKVPAIADQTFVDPAAGIARGGIPRLFGAIQVFLGAPNEALQLQKQLLQAHIIFLTLGVLTFYFGDHTIFS